MRRRDYPSDVSNAEWKILEPLIRQPKKAGVREPQTCAKCSTLFSMWIAQDASGGPCLTTFRPGQRCGATSEHGATMEPGNACPSTFLHNEHTEFCGEIGVYIWGLHEGRCGGIEHRYRSSATTKEQLDRALSLSSA